MKLIQALRKYMRLSRRKKTAILGFLVLLISIIAAAYARSIWLIGLLVTVFVIAVSYAAVRLERRLASARRATRAAALSPALAQERLGALAAWGKHSGLPRPVLVQRLTKLRSLEGRDVLVSSATAGRWVWSDMVAGLEMHRMGGKPGERVTPFFRSASPTGLLHLADLCFRQNILSSDILNAATLYSLAYEAVGAEPFRNRPRGEFFLDCLARTGQGKELNRLLHLYDAGSKNANDVHFFRANSINPFKNSAFDAERWLAQINKVYEEAGLSLLSLRPGDGPAFRRLRAAPAEPVSGGPLVTIVMPVYRPDEVTELAIQSAIGQTYQNLEIIIVDDGSGGDAADRLDKWAKTDERIKVVSNPLNSGAYTSRNIGYSMARGDYLTVFDGDDWQHPQKIELLVRAAVQQPDKRLVSAPWTRVDEDLFFHYRGWRGAFITPAHVSTMFPVKTLRERLGHWDSVRKAADTEFILRYRILVQPEEPLDVSDAPLTLSLVSDSNLSIDDFRLGYRSPDRVAYRESYEHWHSQVRAGLHDGYVAFPQISRSFPAPRRFLPARNGSLLLDCLFVGDFGNESNALQFLLDDVRSATEEGLQVGLMHVPSLLNAKSIDKSYSTQMLEAFAEGELHRVEVTDAVRCDTVNVYDPTAFQYSRNLQSGHQARQVIVRAGEPPYRVESDEHKFDVASVERNLLAVFRAPVSWTSEDPGIARVISQSRRVRIKTFEEMNEAAVSDASLTTPVPAGITAVKPSQES